jgi:hypothetical protein
MTPIPSTSGAATPTKPRYGRGKRPMPEFSVEIPELDDAAIERLAEVFVSMLDTFEQEQTDTPGGEVPPESRYCK